MCNHRGEGLAQNVEAKFRENDSWFCHDNVSWWHDAVAVVLLPKPSICCGLLLSGGWCLEGNHHNFGFNFVALAHSFVSYDNTVLIYTHNCWNLEPWQNLYKWVQWGNKLKQTEDYTGKQSNSLSRLSKTHWSFGIRGFFYNLSDHLGPFSFLLHSQQLLWWVQCYHNWLNYHQSHKNKIHDGINCSLTPKSLSFYLFVYFYFI